jgi:hypothetical protein
VIIEPVYHPIIKIFTLSQQRRTTNGKGKKANQENEGENWKKMIKMWSKGRSSKNWNSYFY